MESNEHSKPLLFTALDVRKAFNIVDYGILKLRLLQVVRDPIHKRNTVDLLTSSEGRVRVQSQFGLSIPILQGVGEGHIWSPLEYTVFINPLLNALRKMAAGSYLGTFNAGFHTCANDIILAQNSELSQQTLISLVTRFAENNHYYIHPKKSEAVSHGKVGKWKLMIDSTSVPYVEYMTHLGME